jgi:hypothetical protein
MKLPAFSLLFLLGINCLPVSAQHHYEYGGSRVVRQSQNGLATPSSTYIGAGTLSKTAQGIEPNNNPNLPNVNYGGAIKTPGDNIYRPKEPQQQRYPQRYQQRRYYMQQQPQPNYYVPGQNSQVYNEYKPDRSNFGYSQPNSSGSATYGSYNQQPQQNSSGRRGF